MLDSAHRPLAVQDRVLGGLRVLVLLAAAVCCYAPLKMHYQSVASSIQLEYREGAVQYLTALMVDNKNPYALEQQPAAASPYGIVYTLTVLPLAKLFGPSLRVHRVMSAAYIAGILLGLCWIARKAGASLALALGMGVLFYPQLLEARAQLARPDALGILLMMMGCAIPIAADFSRASLFIGLGLGLLSGFTKSYYAVGVPPLLLYAFLFRRKGVAVAALAAWVVAGAASLVLVDRLCETYIDNIFVVARTVTDHSVMYIRRQLWAYAKLMPGLVGLTALALLAWVVQLVAELRRTGVSPRISLLDPHKPLLAVAANPWALSLAANLAVFSLFIGGNRGALFMAYLFHLVTPMLIATVLYISSRSRFWAYAATLAVLFNLGVQLREPQLRLDVDEGPWQQFRQAVKSHNNILNSPAMVSLLIEEHKPVYDNGSIEFVIWANKIHANFSPKFKQRIAEFEADLKRQIEQKRFDLALIPSNHSIVPSALYENYTLRKHLTAPMYKQPSWDTEFWEPNPTPAAK